ncbi:MAG: carbohydrate binding family 9 domain-containing protein [Candidatus Aminicenantes bacterium]|nr:carbohydrate binding family 9 domain-containing protein [Candidatus Aminicenantes bacterium]
MKIISMALCLLATTLGVMLHGDENVPAPPRERVVQTRRLTGQVKLDGRLEEEDWRRPPLNGFTQNDPDDGKPCSERTDVWLAYDDDAIYVAARLHDSDPGRIIRLLSRRDESVDADYFYFCVDPLNDKRSGFMFAVNPSGSITDRVIYNDSWTDTSWDGHWEARTTIDDGGWSVEMRIPFDQLRFKKKDNGEEYLWGVNFRRDIKRKNERATFAWVPKTESAFVSRFARMEGMRGIAPRRLFEVIPYTIGKANFLQEEPGNPFRIGEEFLANAGADIKLGLSSSLTLDLTLNPDFGQVEVDPAVINLSAAESYYSEKRPFFIEGAQIFEFGTGGATSSIGADWSTPRLYYTRRIGRAPQGCADTDGFVDYPDWATILGAGKLSGTLGGGWKLGFMTALTEREYAVIDQEGRRSRWEVEPFANHSVLRAQKEFNQGRQGLGFMATSVLRDLRTDDLSSMLSRQAFSLGVDGWTFLGKKKTWAANGWLAGTHVNGTKEQVSALQRSFPHYFQQPDADYLKLDDGATSLSGMAGRFSLNKEKGNVLINAALGFISPGFDSRDMGYQSRGDVINGHVMLGYRSFKKWKFIKEWDALLFTQRNYNFGGDRIGEQRVILINDLTFTNFWSAYWQWSHNPQKWSNSWSRGGPLMRMGQYDWIDWGIWSNSRKPLVLSFGGYHLLSNWGRSTHVGAFTLQWKPAANFNVSFSPDYEVSKNPAQWLANVEDPVKSDTYGTRYVFGNLDQKTLSCSIRLNWIFSPRLSLQGYIQPFIAVGAYDGFKELRRPRSYDFIDYGTGTSIIALDDGKYVIDPGDGGAPLTLDDPDFNYKSLRGTVVLRWEYRLGSTLYLVWTQDRADYQDPGDLSLGRDLGSMLRAPGDNIFMLKFTYRFKI